LPNFLSYLQSAAIRGHGPVVRFLIKRGAIRDAPNEFGRTAMHMAAWNGHLHLIRDLVEVGADPKAKDIRKETPLHMVISSK